MLIETVEFFLVVTVLAVLYVKHDAYNIKSLLFKGHNWLLPDAIKILIPCYVIKIIILYISNIWQYSYYVFSIIIVTLWCAAITILYRKYIKLPYGTNITKFGINKKKYTKSVILIANIFLIFLFIQVNSDLDFYANGNNTKIIFGIAKYEIYCLVLTGIILSFVVPVLEEIVFRAVLYAPIARKCGTISAVFIITIIEAMLHNYTTIGQYVGGMVFSIVSFALMLRMESLYGPIMMHMYRNIFNSITDIGSALSSVICNEVFIAYINYLLLVLLLLVNLSYYFINANNECIES